MYSNYYLIIGWVVLFLFLWALMWELLLKLCKNIFNIILILSIFFIYFFKQNCPKLNPFNIQELKIYFTKKNVQNNANKEIKNSWS